MAPKKSSNYSQERLSHIENLIAIAVCDGDIDPNEIELITNIAIRNGITKQEIEKLLKNPEDISFTPPSSFEEKITQLYDMVCVMIIDGVIYDEEVRVCQYFANKLGFKANIIGKILESMINKVKAGYDPETVKSDLVKEYA